MDNCGNAAANQVQTITVSDNTVPAFTRPADITIFTDLLCAYDASIAITGDVTNESDNCSTGIQATYSDVNVAGPCQGSRIITRTWSLVDNCGNAAANQVQTITVSDNTVPAFTRPADITIFTDLLCAYDASIAITGDVTNESDNCSTGIQATYSDVNDPGPCQGSRIITRTWSLVDNCGNAAANQVQTITVSDNTVPAFTRPADITIFTDLLCAYDASIAITGDVTNESDNCSTGIQATYSDVNVAGPCQGSRIITRTWSLVDNCGNAAANQVQTITVSDNIFPTASAPTSIDIECGNAAPMGATNHAAFVLLGGMAGDNCTPDASLLVAYTDGPLVGTNCVGSIARSYTITDACGNTTTVVQTITVSDNTNPDATANTIATCYDSQAAAEAAAIAATTVTDNCSGMLTKTATTINTSCDFEITVTVTDECGNTDQVFYTTLNSCQTLHLKVFLEGPYNPTMDNMFSQLNIDHLLPGQDKLLSPDMAIQLAAPFTPFGQPYSSAPWNYTGNMGMNFGDPSAPGAPMGVIPYPLDVVDWVLVTVREGGNQRLDSIWSCAGWVHKDGEVTFPETCSPLNIDIMEPYHVVVQHRNHLAVMSHLWTASIRACSGKGLNGILLPVIHTNLPSGMVRKRSISCLLINGLCTQPMVTNHFQLAISSPDRTTWRLLQGVLGYSVGDYNMSSVVTPPDETVGKTIRTRHPVLSSINL